MDEFLFVERRNDDGDFHLEVGQGPAEKILNKRGVLFR